MGDRSNNVKKMLNNPQQRNIYFVIIIIAILTLGVGFYFATKSSVGDTPASATVSSVPSINVVPGSSDSPEYNKQVNIANQNATREALDGDNSFIPTLTNANAVADESPIDLIDRQKEQEKRLREEREAEELKRVKTPEPTMSPTMPPVETYVEVYVPPEPAYVPPKYGQDKYLLIATLMGNTKSKEPKSDIFYPTDDEDKDGNSSGNKAARSDGSYSSQKDAQEQKKKRNVVAKAGTILNAVLETSVNSDEPSPILAKIVSGPLRGTRVIGSTQLVGEKVMLSFSSANIPGVQESIRFSAVAIDPDTNRTAIASSVNNHYLQRYGFLIATSFLGGWSKAVAANNSQTTVTGDGIVVVSPKNDLTASQINRQAIGSVGEEFADIAKKNAQSNAPTVKVNSGVAIGLLIMSDLIVE